MVWEQFENDKACLEKQYKVDYWDKKSGISVEELRENCQQIVSRENMDFVVRRVELIKEVLLKAQIEINPYDWFQDKINHGKILTSIEEIYLEEAYSKGSTEIRKKREISKQCSAYTGEHDFGHCIPDWKRIITYGFAGLKEQAKKKMTQCKEDSFDSGFLGMHVIFSVLSDCGQGELAYHMITKKEYPSFAYVFECGETTFPEGFYPKESGRGYSRNHHFQVDISRWFMTRVAGLNIVDSKHIEIRPDYLTELDYASAHYELPDGLVNVSWEKKEGYYELRVCCPEVVSCEFKLPHGVETRIQTIEKI